MEGNSLRFILNKTVNEIYPCSKEIYDDIINDNCWEDPMEFKIKENRHRTNKLLYFKHYNGRNFMFEGIFSKECWYSKDSVEQPEDKNKLFGVSLEWFPFPKRIQPANWISWAPWHWNSIRLAWRPDFKKEGIINVYPYIYDGGLRITPPKLFSVNVNEKFIVGVESFEHNLETEFKFHAYANNKKYLDEYCFDYLVNPTGFFLPPYFGGNNTSPANMSVYINLLR